MISLLILGVLGLIAGSFVNALVWRVYQQEAAKTKNPNLSIWRGRSQCVNCGHQLTMLDMVPVLSWLFLRAKCRYCSQPISRQYPVVEIAMALVFIFLYAAWPSGVVTQADWLWLITWLLSSVGLMALLVYDLRWMLLPNKIIYRTLAVAVAGRLFYIGGLAGQPLRATGAWLLSVLVASGFFWVLFQLSKGRWIGFGDVRLGLITGSLLGDPLRSLLMIAVASMLACLAILPLLGSGRKQLTSRIAFGPFLILGAWLVAVIGDRLIDQYQRLLG